MLREGEERKAGYLRPRLLFARRADGGSGCIPVSKAAALVCLATLPYQTYRGDSPHRWQAQGLPSISLVLGPRLIRRPFPIGL